MQSRRDQRNSMASSKLMEKGYVTESLSSYVVLVLLVPKKDGSWRMCNDYRAMNNITVK